MAGLEADVGAARREARDLREEKAAMAAQHQAAVQVLPPKGPSMLFLDGPWAG